jgi:hypothetical protein
MAFLQSSLAELAEALGIPLLLGDATPGRADLRRGKKLVSTGPDEGMIPMVEERDFHPRPC